MSFGSFGVSFGVVTSNASGHDSDKCSTPVSEASQGGEETVEEQPARFVLLFKFVWFCIIPPCLAWPASPFCLILMERHQCQV